MPYYAHPDVLDNGFPELSSDGNKAILIAAYSTTYSAVNTTLKVAEAALVGGDYSVANGDAGSREVTIALSGKSAGNAAQSLDAIEAADMHIAIVDTVGERVLLVLPETSDQPITSGNPVTFTSSPKYRRSQPGAL